LRKVQSQLHPLPTAVAIFRRVFGPEGLSRLSTVRDFRPFIAGTRTPSQAVIDENALTFRKQKEQIETGQRDAYSAR
jgi:hypothetical protein